MTAAGRVLAARGLTGTGALLRFNLRRDRTRITVWTASIGSLYLYCVFALATVFGDEASQQARAALMRTPASILMTGPGYGLDNYTLGPIMANELMLWFIVALGLMSAMQYVRLTRAEEESSRAELIRAGVVGRHAPVAAAWLTVLIANAAVAVVGFLALVAGGLDVEDSLAYAAAVALGALCIGAVTAIAAQACEHARTASGVGVAVLMVAVLVRGVGDMEAVGGTLVSWFSPIAWSQQTRVYVDLRWWPLLLPVLFTVACLAVAALLAARRDFGAGLFTVKPGPPAAARSLNGPWPLTWRLSRTTLLWWGVGFAIMFLAVGTYADAISGTLQNLIADNPVVADIFDPNDLTGAFVQVMMLFGALTAAGYGISGILRARGEEADGRAELVLTSAVSRPRWFAAQIGIPAAGATALMIGSALFFFAGALTVGVTDPGVGGYLAAAASYLPAVAVIIGLAAALLAWAPRLLGLAWAAVAWGFVDGLLGDALNLPAPLRWISPVHWVPNPLSSQPQNYVPLAVVGVLAVALFASAFIGYRRRGVPGV